jgi:protease secretion system membrane fusion protein
MTASDISKTLSSIAGIRLQLAQALTTRRKDIESQLPDIQKIRMSQKSKAESLRYDLSLAEIRAPVAGVVVNTKVFTVGGVIQGGVVLMEIVPQESTLIVEAQIPPDVIDKVHLGLNADMRFTAFSQNTTPVIPGKVKLVGADKIPDLQKPGNEYYLAQIETTAKGRVLLGSNVIQPGMPVDVIIKTGERSFMSYLTKPFADRLAKSFKED